MTLFREWTIYRQNSTKIIAGPCLPGRRKTFAFCSILQSPYNTPYVHAIPRNNCIQNISHVRDSNISYPYHTIQRLTLLNLSQSSKVSTRALHPSSIFSTRQQINCLLPAHTSRWSFLTTSQLTIPYRVRHVTLANLTCGLRNYISTIVYNSPSKNWYW